MKVLLETCVWGGAVKDLRSGGHDVVWSGDWPEDPGDEEILARAHSEHRVLVTLDKDFVSSRSFTEPPTLESSGWSISQRGCKDWCV